MFYSVYVDEVLEDPVESIGEQEKEKSDVETNNVKNNSNRFIYDLVNYVHHHDDKMKTNVCALIGQLVNSILIEYNGDYGAWLVKMVGVYFSSVNRKKVKLEKEIMNEQLMQESHMEANEAYNSLRLELLIDYLMRFIKFDNQMITNNMCKRAALRYF